MRVYAIGSTMLLSVYSHGATDIHTLDYDGRWRLSSLPTTRTDIARMLRFYRKGPAGTVKITREKVNI